MYTDHGNGAKLAQLIMAHYHDHAGSPASDTRPHVMERPRNAAVRPGVPEGAEEECMTGTVGTAAGLLACPQKVTTPTKDHVYD